jgi:hypothetical protein
MPENVQVSWIYKRDRLSPHERIKMLGGMHNGKIWNQEEEAIIAELEKPEATRLWNYYTDVGGHKAQVVISSHENRKYLKTVLSGK